MIRQRDYRRFLWRFLALIALPALVAAADLIVVWRGGELTSYEDIAARQGQVPAIFGAAFNQNAFGYKLAMVRRDKPDVVAVGSSRVMLFRHELFKSSFVNAGGSSNFLNEMREFLEAMLAFHKPKLVVLGLDFWWFNPAYPEPESYPYHQGTGTQLNYDKLTKPFAYLFDRRMPPSAYLRLIFAGGKTNPANGFENYGLRASVWCNGFRPDGSHLYGESAFGLNPDFFDAGFADTLANMNLGTGYFLHAPDISEARLAELADILDLCGKAGVKVVAVMPPLAAPVLAFVKAHPEWYPNQHKLAALLPAFALEHGAEGYDVSDLTAFGSSDCECLDGFHGGDVTYARLLAQIARQNPDSAVVPHLDPAGIAHFIDGFAGRAIVTEPAGLYHVKEVDFLRLGCPKPGGPAPDIKR